MSRLFRRAASICLPDLARSRSFHRGVACPALASSSSSSWVSAFSRALVSSPRARLPHPAGPLTRIPTTREAAGVLRSRGSTFVKCRAARLSWQTAASMGPRPVPTSVPWRSLPSSAALLRGATTSPPRSRRSHAESSRFPPRPAPSSFAARARPDGPILGSHR
jgi:hypothetical protein